jgi:DNA-binding transcriptional regulator of glucitol operon
MLFIYPMNAKNRLKYIKKVVQQAYERPNQLKNMKKVQQAYERPNQLKNKKKVVHQANERPNQLKNMKKVVHRAYERPNCKISLFYFACKGGNF